MDYHSLYPHLIHSFTGDHDLVNAVNVLKENFTSHRHNIKRYRDDARLVSAYALIYMLTNKAKFNFILNQLNSEQKADLLACNFVEIGCGPGTFLWSLIDSFPEFSSQMWGIEISPLMREQGEKLAKYFYPDKKIFFTDEISRIPKSKPSVVVFGHSFNEIGLDEALKMIEQLSPKGIIFLEPGTRESFESLVSLRTILPEKGYSGVYPCPNFSSSCPLEIRDDWCHQKVFLKHEESLERICQMAKLDRRTMAICCQIYWLESLKNSETKDYTQAKFRYLRFLNETKFSLDIEVCTQEEFDGGQNLIAEKWEILKKGLKKSQVNDFKKISWGQDLELNSVKKMANGQKVTWEQKTN